jgi:hypothetical protein
MTNCADREAIKSASVAQITPREEAERLFAANRGALARTQPEAAEQVKSRRAERSDQLAELTWIFGRDGSLTARDVRGRWWGGSSLPLRVGRELMHSLESRGQVGCFLAPGTAGQLRAVLEKITPDQAIIAVLPDEVAALVLLHCVDFSAEMDARQLWLACGENWPQQLADLLRFNEGLCIPQQYIRTGLIEGEQLQQLLSIANGVFSTETARRQKRFQEPLIRYVAVSRRICVVAGSRFGLSDMAGPALAETLCTGDRFQRLDSSRPTSASPMALANAVAECEALVAPDLYRADLPGVVPDDVRWITWATQPRFAAPAAAGDVLLVIDERWRGDAIAAGWAADRVKVAAWPMLGGAAPTTHRGPLALIADVAPALPPERLKKYSSQSVLWEQITAELEANPWALGKDLDAYLNARITQLDIDTETLDRSLFLNGLIPSAWRRGAARSLANAKVPLKLYGTGWDSDSELAQHWAGPIASLQELRQAAAGAMALVYPSPIAQAHPVNSLGRPVIIAQRSAAMLRQAQDALSGRLPAPAIPSAVLSEQAVLLSL